MRGTWINIAALYLLFSSLILIWIQIVRQWSWLLLLLLRRGTVSLLIHTSSYRGVGCRLRRSLRILLVLVLFHIVIIRHSSRLILTAANIRRLLLWPCVRIRLRSSSWHEPPICSSMRSLRRILKQSILRLSYIAGIIVVIQLWWGRVACGSVRVVTLTLAIRIACGPIIHLIRL